MRKYLIHYKEVYDLNTLYFGVALVIKITNLSTVDNRIGLIRWLTNVSRCVATYWKMDLRLK
jgi:hypothetical protein